MAKLAQASTQVPADQGSKGGPRPEPQATADEAGTGAGDTKGVSTSIETQSPPTPIFTQQEYGVMLLLLAAFVILLGSLMGRRGS
jgi:hypothetical protein